MKPSIGAKSDVGRVRDGNEDSYLVQEPIFVVADGMGGHLAGDVASRIAVQTISERAGDGAAADPEAIEKAVKEANAAIYEKASSDPSLHGMGTTCTLVLVADSEIHIAHVGDSRAYLLRDGELSQLTEDHTLVGRMVKEGRLQPEEAERHPQRSIITRALGVDDHVEVDLQTIPVEEGDKVLICSDGLSSMIDSDSIQNVLASNDDPQRAVDELIDRANDAGGEDNITAVVLAFDGGEGGLAARGAESAPPTEEVEATRSPRRDESVQPRAEPKDVTGAFEVSAARPSRRGSRPILVTLVLVALVIAAAAAAFKYLIVANSYYVAANDTGRLAIYRGLPDEVMGMTFQEELETSDVTVDELPSFLMEDVNDAIEADSLEHARTTLANLEERAQDDEFQRRRDAEDGGSG
ncbi:MAG: Stp1/IreP family PP2C-type Ser/Thr phosphatase [Actinobacteria bacterium]|nr:Stp1/IreP family PP2C-type Ser/Thr phosphatase [Actinomycetota bacterium]